MIKRAAFHIYNAVIVLALPLILLWVIIRWHRRILGKGLDRWAERRGILSPELQKQLASGRWWWVHAVSMGEVKAIDTFLRRAPEQAGVRVLLSVVTPEALAWAEQQHLVDVLIAAPIDLPWMVRRVFRQVKPEIFISVESEFWPNLLREAKRSGACVALINGRLSQRSFTSYRRVRGIMAALWECFDLFSVRQEEDARRFRELGVSTERIRVTGNLKYDLAVDRRRAERPAPEKREGLVLVIGSTREGEERELLPVLEQIRPEVPGLCVIWAPRHIERVNEVEQVLAGGGRAVTRRSAWQTNGHMPPNLPSDLVWDTMGDLLDAYRLADLALIGGSFVPKGGQNPLEPAALRVPVVFGPSMDNFHGIADQLLAHGGARQVELSQLADCLCNLLRDPAVRHAMGDKAHSAVEAQQGASDRTLELLKGLSRG